MRKVSIGGNIHQIEDLEEIEISHIVDFIKYPKNKKYVERYVSEFNKMVDRFDAFDECAKEYSNNLLRPLKKDIPYITFSGLFKRRNDSSLIEHSNIILIDVDNPKLWERVDTCLNVEYYRQALKKDPHVYMFFRSPTNGFKIAFKKPQGTAHAIAYMSCLSYVQAVLKLPVDDVCSDVCRACFINYDPEAWMNEDCKEIRILSNVEVEAACNKQQRNISKIEKNTDVEYGEIKPLVWIDADRARFVLKNLKAYDNNNHSDWLDVAMALHFQFEGRKVGFDILDEWSMGGTGYDHYNNLARYHSFGSYRGHMITFGSLLDRDNMRDKFICALILRHKDKERRLSEYRDIGHKIVDRSNLSRLLELL